MFWAIIFVISMSLLSKVQGEESLQFLFERKPGYTVFVPPDKNAKHRKYFVSNDLKCALRCTKEEWCNSANFELVSENDVSGGHLCELLSTDDEENVKYLEKNEKFVHLSIKMLTHPCQKQPCLNEGTCIKVDNRGGFECRCVEGFWGEFCQEDLRMDFENGIKGWTKTGTAFNNQPTYGDNPTARNLRQPAQQQGDWWIGGYENRSDPSHPAGGFQGDGPTGTLTSPVFRIMCQTLSFLIGGGCEVTKVRVELLIDHQVVKKETGKCNESMERRFWDVSAYQGKVAPVRLVDNSSGDWGHINFDDLSCV